MSGCNDAVEKSRRALLEVIRAQYEQALMHCHARIQGLLEANNQELEKRRQAETERDTAVVARDLALAEVLRLRRLLK